MDDDAEFEAHLAALEGAYDEGRGNKAALLEMMLHCAMEEKRLPEWARNAFIDGYLSVQAGAARSWDYLFGEPHRGRHLRTVRANTRAREIHQRVRDLHKGGMPIDPTLFALVAEETGIGGKTLVSELYYWIEQAERRASGK